MKRLYSCILVLFACIVASSANAGVVRVYVLQDLRTNLCFTALVDHEKTNQEKDGAIVYERLHFEPCDEVGKYVSKKEMEMQYSKKKNICYARLPKENIGPILPNSKESMAAYKKTQTVVACSEEVKKLIASK